MVVPVNLPVLCAAESLLRPSGLSLNDAAVLDELSRHEPLSSGEIADALSLAPATVTRCTEKLVNLHMVRVSLDGTDLRRNVFRLEVRGHAVLFEIRKSLADTGTLEEALQAHRFLSSAAGCKRGAKGKAARSALSPSALRLLLVLEEGPCSVGEASRRAGLGQSTASMAFGALEEKALVAQRDTDDCDGRKRCFALTRQGREHLRALAARVKG